MPLPGGPESQEALRHLRGTIDRQAKPDVRLFIMARLPSEAGAHDFSIVSWIEEELRKVK